MVQNSSIPILKLKEFLIVSIQTDLHDRMAEQLQYDILHRISETNAKGVLIDISALEMVDSFIGRTLADTARMAATLDADIVIVGMQPAVAITLVELGLSMGEVRTAINLDEGYELLAEKLKGETPHTDDADGAAVETEEDGNGTD
ncbi:STAS domain-containing protein [candidate division WOR-3 bacterium]|uniref:STAS domain-containing protein n=1 Tax=candidate division WOR-3 bacterium TaxID=2052148 RepID=A0A9D5K8Y5_UNCW3|nr:STAS domain-containing protein [candidate division WOR-3 bacterium]MBD3364638.1 STAS domain-containing protein [candidate division WOR-3 bacterium]